MKYLSIDIETTGLDPEKHQILEFAAVYDDLENLIPVERLPTFVRRIYWNDLVINNWCMKLHKGLLTEIAVDWAANSNIITIDQLSSHFGAWLARIGSGDGYNVAGKNFAGFDGLFLKKILHFPRWFYRVIDVGSLYLEPSMNQLPSLSEISKSKTEHRALPDALDVVKVVRQHLGCMTLPKQKYLIQLTTSDRRRAIVIDWNPREAQLRANMFDPNNGWLESTIMIITTVNCTKINRVLAFEK